MKPDPVDDDTCLVLAFQANVKGINTMLLVTMDNNRITSKILTGYSIPADIEDFRGFIDYFLFHSGVGDMD